MKRANETFQDYAEMLLDHMGKKGHFFAEDPPNQTNEGLAAIRIGANSESGGKKRLQNLFKGGLSGLFQCVE